MKLKVLLSFLVVVLVSSLTIQPLSMRLSGTDSVIARQPVTMEQAQKSLKQSSACFIENKGQWDSRILYMGDASFGRIAFTQNAVYYELQPNDKKSTSSHVVELFFQNSLSPKVQGIEPLTFYTNYFIGNDSSKWASHCKTYRSVTYQDIWEGIDMAYFFTPEGLKYEYYIHSGADISDLQVKLIGASMQTLDSSRYLEMVTPIGSLKDDQLKAFTQKSKQPIDASFSIQDDILSFSLENTNREETIVVDPLLYATFLGGLKYDTGRALQVDPEGNAYVVGTTESTEFPMATTPGGDPAPGYDKDYNGTFSNIYLVKINPSGTELLYATFFGSTTGNSVATMLIDSLGCAYIAASSGDDFPMTKTIGGAAIPGYDQTPGGGLIFKVNPEGTELVYATRIKNVTINDMDLDSLGSVYFTGTALSDEMPKTKTVGGSVVPGYDQTFHGPSFSPMPGLRYGDAYAIKLNPEGTELVYSTYLGGTKYDSGWSIHVDANFNTFVAGDTDSTDFPMTKTVGGSPAPGYDQTINSTYDSFLLKLNPEGTELISSSYFGGETGAFVTNMVTDSSGCLYAVGRTFSFDFPMTKTQGGELAPGYEKNYFDTHSTNQEGFLVKFNPDATEQIYSTFLGKRNSIVRSIKLDPAGNAWIIGTNSFPVPMTTTLDGTDLPPGYQQTKDVDMSDIFVYQLNSLGTELRYSSYFCGSGMDAAYWGRLIDLDSAGNLYALCVTYSVDFPMTTEVGGPLAPGYDKDYNDNCDAVVFKIENPYRAFTVTASVLDGLGTVSPATQEVLPGDNATIIITPAAGYGIESITDNGQSKAVVSPYIINNVTENHVVDVTFEVAFPELKIWAEANKPTFTKNDTVMLLVTIANQGNATATATRVTMTLPQELSYLRATRYVAIEQTARMIEFEVGALAGNSIQTFQVDASVNAVVSHSRSIPIFFDNTCAEKSIDSANVMIILESKKTGDSSLYLGIYFRNVMWDPVTSAAYILIGTPLELNFTLSGAQLPYELSMNWGDGTIEKLTQQNETNLLLKHKFTSKGKMTMKFQVIDSHQKTMIVTITIEVR
jgi:uncharacterized repeat protein (TIGR01451 family)